MRSASSYVMLLAAAVVSGLAQPAHGGVASAAGGGRIDGRTVDQAVAYVLMAAALAVTYLVH